MRVYHVGSVGCRAYPIRRQANLEAASLDASDLVHGMRLHSHRRHDWPIGRLRLHRAAGASQCAADSSGRRALSQVWQDQSSLARSPRPLPCALLHHSSRPPIPGGSPGSWFPGSLRPAGGDVTPTRCPVVALRCPTAYLPSRRT